ncbi:LuxR family transcriptional regulator [Natronococcus amylolyticus DSM 10524]|uniref:LuxR family transcriptional regulator n=1 Tax=Natronococcus amylolyticus DSM 10524 TaxID=1227497 RepID=L9X3H5_9EURY|nr:helix-turn-helix domain-containing protein [Natronococcus amylolyticus]ELY56280.1 LuxR family transcriptional regulator [Natronococcus amylolyticus DSM 10524]
MSHIGEMVVRHSDLSLTTTLEEVENLDIRVESQTTTPTDTLMLFYLVQTPDFDQFESSLRSDHTVVDWEVNAEVTESRIYKIGFSDETKILPFTESGLRFMDATGVDGGWQVRVHASERSHFEEFLAYCHGEDIECHLKKVFSRDVSAQANTEDGGGLRLTDRQREVARTATEMRYFETGGASAEEVAAALDISPSTLSSHLRKIRAKLFEYHFGS